MFARQVLSAARRTARPIVQKRKMGGGHAPPVPTEGFEGAIRKVLPKNEHVALAIIGGYFSLYMISKLFSGGKKEEIVTSPSAAGAADGEIPSSDSPAFSDWLATEGNIEKALNAIK